MLAKKPPPLRYSRSDADSWIDALNQLAFYVKDYGAADNDTGDDGPAIQAAINDAHVVGGVVYLGHLHRLATPIVVTSGVTLRGAGWAGGHRGTYLHVVATPAMLTTAAITIAGYGVRLLDFAVEHDQPTPGVGWAPTPYPYAIRCVGLPELANDVLIENIFLFNATNGIQLGAAASSIAVGRIHLRNISGQVFGVGIKDEYSLDTIRIEHVHFWPFWSDHANVKMYNLTTTVGLWLERSDGVIVDSFFSLWHFTGVLLGHNALGQSMRSQITNLNTDAIGGVGILVAAGADNTTAQITNYCMTREAGYGDTNALAVNAADVYLQLANFYAAGVGRRAIFVGGASRIDVSNFTCEVWSQESPGSTWAAIEVAHGGAIVTLDQGARFARTYGIFITPANAPEVSGAGLVIQPGYRGFVHLRASADQSLPHNTNYAVQFDVEVHDPDDLHVAVANTRVGARRTGWYRVSCGLRFSYSAAGGVRTAQCRIDGTTFAGGVSAAPSYTSTLSTPAYLTHTTDIYLVTGQYFEILLYQDTGGLLTLQQETGRSPELMVSYLGV